LNESIDLLDEKLKYKTQLILETQSKIYNSDVQTMKAKYLNIGNIKDAQVLAGVLFDELMKHAEQEKRLLGMLSEKEVALEQSKHESESIRRELVSARAEITDSRNQTLL
jgi:hypothetical protein